MRKASRTERKVWIVVSVMLLTVALMFFVRNRSVHVVSSHCHRDEHGEVLYEIDVRNPTAVQVVATIALAIGNPIDRHAIPSGAITYNVPVEIPAESTVTTTKTFEGPTGRRLGRTHSCHIVSVKKSQ